MNLRVEERAKAFERGMIRAGVPLGAKSWSMKYELPELNASAAARIKRDEAAAEQKLGDELTQFFASCDTGVILEQLECRPSSRHVFPFLKSYALAVFDAEARERLAVIDSPERCEIECYTELLSKLAGTVVGRISGQDGVWWRVVEQNCRHFDLGSWPSPYGTYGFVDFLNPFANRLKPALLLRIKYWEAQGWDLLSTKPECNTSVRTESKSQPTDVQPAYRTRLGHNIDKLRAECGWSYNKLAEEANLDKKQIIGHVKHGKGGHPQTIKKYLVAFNKKLDTAYTVEELTNTLIEPPKQHRTTTAGTQQPE